MQAEAVESFTRDVAACRLALRGGSRTFYLGSLLLPRRIREPAAALYAFCRCADDAVDLPEAVTDSDVPAAALAVERLYERLDRAYAGRPLPTPVDRAFATVVARHAIPRAIPAALLEGFAWDAAGRRYETLEDLYDYAARVAGTVGAMMSLVMGRREPAVLARACELGIAMQLSNIARDVGEDARAGRLYLPLQWLREAGIDPEAWLAQPVYDAALAAVVARLLGVADRLYAQSSAGIAALPRSCQPGIHASGLIYAEIGRALRREAHDPVATRVVVPPLRKAGLVATALFATLLPVRAATASPTLDAVQPLLEAVALTIADESPAGTAPGEALGPIEQRLAWLVDLFVRLEQRDQRLRAETRQRAIAGA